MSSGWAPKGCSFGNIPAGRTPANSDPDPIPELDPFPEPEQFQEPYWDDGGPPLHPLRASLVRLIARIALVAFLVAFPLGIVVDSFYRSSYPEASLAVVEVVLVGALALWLRGLRRH